MGGGFEHEQEDRELFPPYTFNLVLIQAIEDALRLAWSNTAKRRDVNLDSDKEESITAALQDELIKIYNSKENVPEFNDYFFHRPTRGEKHKDFSGKAIEMEPDLKVGIKKREIPEFDLYYAYFIECKIIQRKDDSVARYAQEGIQRFVDGKYAWATTRAGMIAYVRREATHRQTTSSLRDYYNAGSLGDKRRASQALAREPQPADDNVTVVTTIHDRSFTLRDEEWNDTGENPGPIILRHLWLYPE